MVMVEVMPCVDGNACCSAVSTEETRRRIPFPQLDKNGEFGGHPSDSCGPFESSVSGLFPDPAFSVKTVCICACVCVRVCVRVCAYVCVCGGWGGSEFLHNYRGIPCF